MAKVESQLKSKAEIQLKIEYGDWLLNNNLGYKFGVSSLMAAENLAHIWIRVPWLEHYNKARRSWKRVTNRHQ